MHIKLYKLLIISILAIFLVNESCNKADNKYEKRAEILVKHPEINNYFAVEKDGISMYADSLAKIAKRVECKIYFSEIAVFNELAKRLSADSLLKFYEQKGSSKIGSKYSNLLKTNQLKEKRTLEFPLRGIKIAIDAGHIAGDTAMADFEGRIVQIEDTNGKNPPFYEAKLTYATARFLEKSLLKLGAEVLLTRKKHGFSAFNKSFSDWLKNDFQQAVKQQVTDNKMKKERAKYWLSKADSQEIFRRFFLPLETQHRADLINAFQPDLSIVIHYNVDYPNWLLFQQTGFYAPTTKNYSMVFVPGSFAKNELKRMPNRMEFLRLLAGQDLGKSIRLSEKVQQAFTQVLEVEAVPRENDLPYLQNYSILTGKEGVYARNLALTRLIHSPLCYGESLCQDNVFEYPQLIKNDVAIAEIIAPKRSQEVATAYLQGILAYFQVEKSSVKREDLPECEKFVK